MRCYVCKMMIMEDEQICPHCGANMKAYKQVLQLSDYYYNQGLERAQVRDLSGAIENLKLSVKYNKYNTNARNLLGLVYFETQELVQALAEWVISTNYEPHHNMASLYLKEFEDHPDILEESNAAIRKYNQALQYCRADSSDLAIIQLKKVLEIAPRLIRAHQLLALLYMKDGKYELAQRTLRDAAHIDTNNTTTMRYMKELQERLQNDKSKKKKKDDLLSYTSGNETIIMPKYWKKSASIASTIIYTIIGVTIGLLAELFLILPAQKQQLQEEYNNSVAEMAKNLSDRSNNVVALEERIQSLEKELEDYEVKEDVTGSNDILIRAYLTATQGDINTAGELLTQVNTDFLGVDAMDLYETTSAMVNSQYMADLYNTGYEAYQVFDYDLAIESLLTVVDIDPYYAEGGALYYLGQSYRKGVDLESAKPYYAKLVKAFPNTGFASTAAKYVSDIEVEQAGIAVYVSPEAEPEPEPAVVEAPPEAIAPQPEPAPVIVDPQPQPEPEPVVIE